MVDVLVHSHPSLGSCVWIPKIPTTFLSEPPIGDDVDAAWIHTWIHGSMTS